MEVRHLRYFIAVAEELNFTRAAERLHMAQPPLSTRIRMLEDELGAPLFVRDKRRVHLTQAGKELLGRARALLADLDEAGAATRRAAAGRLGRLAIGYTASAIFTDRLPAAIRRFRAAHPLVDLQMHQIPSLEQLHALNERRLDAGVLRKPDANAPDGVAVEPWYRAPLVVALPADHALARQKGVQVADLSDQPLIAYPRDSGIGLYWQLRQLCSRAGFTPQIVREVSEPLVMIGLVAAGQGLAVVPAATTCISLPGVDYRPLLGRESVSTLYLAHRVGESDPLVLQFLSTLRGRRAAGPAAGQYRRVAPPPSTGKTAPFT